ncbi:MAG: hypothetical protein WD737_06030 [Gemmatimonadota bacterium]
MARYDYGLRGRRNTTDPLQAASGRRGYDHDFRTDPGRTPQPVRYDYPDYGPAYGGRYPDEI